MPDTLADFLLARITEDERGAQAEYVTAQAGLGLLHYLRSDPSVFATVQGQQMRQAQRTVAECEAKRLVVNRCLTLNEQAEELQRPSFEGQALAWRVAVRFLAMPYADHPDYHPEWSLNA